MLDDAFESDPRRIQDRTHRYIADAIYRQTFGNVKILRVDESKVDDTTCKALDILGIDFHVKFHNETQLSGQEKFLSYSARQFRTITISEYSWKHCTAQIYFVGYLTQNEQGFDPWVILDWPAVMIATALGRVSWGFRHSKGAYPAFWFTHMDDLPAQCLIASAL